MDENKLFVVVYEGDSGDDVNYVAAPDIRTALTKWKAVVARYINEDYRAEEIDKVLTASDVDDPVSIELVAESYEWMP